MNVFFCTGCNAGLVFGQRRCPACGTRPGASMPLPKLRSAWNGWMSGISAFFASQASLSLTTLLVFLGLGIALAPAGWSYVSRQIDQPAQPVAAAQAPCQGLLVFFSEMATMGEVSALVGELGVAVVSGPNAAGAFELAVPIGSADAVATTLGHAENVVDGVFFKSRCGTP